jgi:hypothetical protein
MKRESQIQDFNVQNPLQQREVKPRTPGNKISLYREVFANTVCYLMRRLTLTGGLQEVYTGRDDDLYCHKLTNEW